MTIRWSRALPASACGFSDSGIESRTSSPRFEIELRRSHHSASGRNGHVLGRVSDRARFRDGGSVYISGRRGRMAPAEVDSEDAFERNAA